MTAILSTRLKELQSSGAVASLSLAPLINSDISNTYGLVRYWVVAFISFRYIETMALKPSKSELIDAHAWVKDQDVSEGWPAHVKGQFLFLAEKLKYEFSATDLS